jgi:predicted CxxxxCH...CXXCH cytochrome family protein
MNPVSLALHKTASQGQFIASGAISQQWRAVSCRLPAVRTPTLANRLFTSPTTSSGPLSSQYKFQSRTAQLALHFNSPHSSPTMASLPISEKGYHSKAPSTYTARKIGAPNTLEHRIFIEKDGVPLSPFHDIPLYANEQQTVLNMIVEVPRWTNAKMEVSCQSCHGRF